MPNSPLPRWAAALAAALLAGCAAPPPAAELPLAPPPEMHTEGLPPIPRALADRLERYTEFRGHDLAAWHPSRPEMLVTHRRQGDSTLQLHRLSAPLGPLATLTRAAEPVREATVEPRQGRTAVFPRGRGGDEVYRLYRVDLDGGAETPLTPAEERAGMLGWLHRSSRLLATSFPVDRTAAGGTRERVEATLWLIDPLAPEARRAIVQLPGAGWFSAAVSPDDREAVLMRYRSSTEAEMWRIDLQRGTAAPLAPRAPDAPPSLDAPLSYTPDGRGLLVVSDRASEFRELMHLDLATGAWTRLSAHIPWDVAEGSASDDGSLVALKFNVDGRGEVRLFDGRTLKERPLPALPPGAVDGVKMHPTLGLVGVTIERAREPATVYVIDLARGRCDPWTQPAVPPPLAGLPPSEQRIVRWQSFDGRTISGILTPPAARFAGRRPVLVSVHGGPEAQATMGFLGRQNYFPDELGIAVIEPNVRGSSGYGKTFLALDNGRLREDAVRDLGALLDWIATQPDLDPQRVVVTGGSYGGYMALAASVQLADRIAGAIDIVGISNFVTFLERTESYRRDLRRAEYGDERDPQMRAFLERISPLNQAERITKPLMVVQGRNDPRVPYTEAEQIVAKLRARGTPVWYLRAGNEGHGFARKENADFLFHATVLFVEHALLGRR